MTNKLWGGRFAVSTDSAVEHFTASIHVDVELVYEDILGSLAHIKMLKHCQIITETEYATLQQGLHHLLKKIKSKEIEFQIKDEDIHMNIERLLYLTIGEVAYKLHTARSRNDQVALDMHLYLRKQIISTIELILQLQKTLIELAEKHVHVLLPGYTHLQRAQPIFLSLHWLAYVSMFKRDVERLKTCWTQVNQCPLGAAALAGSSFNIDPSYVANELGFDGVYQNTMDAVSDRDFVVEFLATSSLTMMHLSRLSEEIILWSSQEFDFIELADDFCTGSSIMPQKKNPDVAELVRAKTSRVYGALMTLLSLLKGLPLAYNRDLQEDKEPLFDTVKILHSSLFVYNSLFKNLKINTAKMKNATQKGFLNATALAEFLVKKGMTFREAHEIVGKMVSYCLKKEVQIESLPIDEMKTFSNLIDEHVYQVLKVENIAMFQEKRKTYSSIETQLLTNKQLIVNTEKWVGEKNKLLADVLERF